MKYFLHPTKKHTISNDRITAGTILRKQLDDIFINDIYNIDLSKSKSYLKNSSELKFAKKVYKDPFCSECEHLDEVILVLEIKTSKKEVTDIIAKLNHSYYFTNYQINHIIENSEILYEDY